MNISIFGLGYVGAVTAGCLTRRGHAVIGVDVHPHKVESFNQGLSPIVEPGLDELLKSAKARGLLTATTSVAEAIAGSDLSIVCVGTPSKVTGALDLGFVRAVTEQIAGVLRARKKRHVLVFRSTMLPGSTAQLAQEFLRDLSEADLLQVFYFPEFLREGTAVGDFDNPALAVVGTHDGTPPAPDLLKALFGENVSAVNWPTAEMVKYACNAFHATKIAFANEIGRVSKQMNIDSHAVMGLLCQDTKLNLSPYYLKPGNPFGGSCLPKDVRALIQHARVHAVNVPVLENLLPSNERHLQSLLSLITDSGKNEVCILGLSFKPNTDDLRESSMVEVAQTLLGRGFKLRMYDPALNLAALVGANKRLIDTKMPHLASQLCHDLAAAVGNDGVIVAAQRCASIAELKEVVSSRHCIIDVNGWPELRELPARYEGFCW